jgi:DNA-binding MarR family transcriptional regulator
MDPEALGRLAAPVRSQLIESFTASLSTVFLVAATLTVLAFMLATLLQERPLRGGVAAGSGVGESFAIPPEGDSLAQVSRQLWALLSRESKRRLLERIAARAGVDLSAAGCWLLARFDEHPDATPAALAQTHGIEPGRLEAALDELREKGLVTHEVQALTLKGHDVLDRLVAARQAGLAELLADWSPEQHRDLLQFLHKVAGNLASETPTGPGRSRS